MDFTAYLRDRHQRINTVLNQFLPEENQQPINLHAAMRYSVFNGGKRLRPILVYATGETFGATLETLDIPACSIEFMHAFSLIHDDLPAMDNDDLRRGKPTCHIAFDEATAILAGDSLSVLAFKVLSQQQQLPPSVQLKMIDILGSTCGSQGMAGGQDIDIHTTGAKLSIAQLENMYHLKTGKLLSACMQFGALTAQVKESTILSTLDEFAQCIGLAFQIQDDILDIEGTTEKIGKPVGSDANQGKITYPELVGIDAAKNRVFELQTTIEELLNSLTVNTTILKLLSDYILHRDY